MTPATSDSPRNASVTSAERGSAAGCVTEELYRKSGAEKYGIGRRDFGLMLAEIARRYLPAKCTEEETEKLYGSLHLEELALARACAAGDSSAWEEFVGRFREKLRLAARRITGDESRGQELADSLHANLYGTKIRDGHRISKLASYCGRGSLEGWLRTVLAQEYVNRWRDARRMVSLEGEGSGSEPGYAPDAETKGEIDARVNEATDEALDATGAEDRYLLASYYLDHATLAQIGRVLRVHESTVSRRLSNVAQLLRKQICAGLMRRGMKESEAQEALDVDVRDMTVDIRKKLAQEPGEKAFPKESPLSAGEAET